MEQFFFQLRSKLVPESFPVFNFLRIILCQSYPHIDFYFRNHPYYPFFLLTTSLDLSLFFNLNNFLSLLITEISKLIRVIWDTRYERKHGYENHQCDIEFYEKQPVLLS